jgi:hypothetical protein
LPPPAKGAPDYADLKARALRISDTTPSGSECKRP